MGKDNTADQAAGQAAEAQTKLAQQLVGETTPLRQNLISDAGQFVSGERDVTSLPEFRTYKNTAEDQYQRARDSVIGSTPEGGGLTAALTQLEGQRAGNLADFTGALAGTEIQRALQLATFGAAQGSQGLGSAGFLQGQRAQAQANQNAGKAGGLGTALGTGAGLAVGLGNKGE